MTQSSLTLLGAAACMYARAAVIAMGLFTSPSVVQAQTTYTATASIAALQAYGSSSSTVAHAHVVAYYSNGTTGGGDFDWVAACPGTANGGTWIAASGVKGGCWVREVSGGLTPEMFGAKGTIPPLTNCSIASGAAVATCPGHTFGSGDVGDLASFYLAGATHFGGRNWTLNSTIVSVRGSTATLAVKASNTVSSAGVFAFGPDDTAAMNAALASNGPTTAFILSAPAYMITSTFNIGNNSPTWTHNIATFGNPTIICAISNHTDDCVDRQSYNNGSGYLTSFITGGITFDSMNNGLEGFNDKGGYNVYQENVSIKRSYRDCWARTVSDALIQQYTAVNTSLFECGLHGILNWTSDNKPYNGSIDEVMHIGLDIEGWGYNSGQFGVTGNQLGAAIYSVNTGSAAQNFILGHTFLGPVEIDSDRAQALAYGTDQNPNAIFFADGQQPNTVFGGCVTAPCSNAVGYSFKRWYFESPTIECSAGCSTPASGALFAFQTTRLVPNAMRFQDLVFSGHWTYITSNISFGTDCSASGNGCGNFLSQANQGGTPSQSLGYNLAAPAIAASGAITAGGAVTGSDLAYNQTLRSSVAPITVPFATPTDITSNFGKVHNWVEVSGECAGANFDDWVPWQYFGKTPITQALKGDVYGTAPSRTYTINPGTGYLSLATSVVNASCSVHVSPFGGY